MAFCLAERPVERGGFDAGDQMDHYVCWNWKGYLSSTGECFDIGDSVTAAPRRYELHGTGYLLDALENGALRLLEQ